MNFGSFSCFFSVIAGVLLSLALASPSVLAEDKPPNGVNAQMSQRELTEIALSHPDVDARCAAVKRLTDRSLLAKVFDSSPHESVRNWALNTLLELSPNSQKLGPGHADKARDIQRVLLDRVIGKKYGDLLLAYTVTEEVHQYVPFGTVKVEIAEVVISNEAREQICRLTSRGADPSPSITIHLPRSPFDERTQKAYVDLRQICNCLLKGLHRSELESLTRSDIVDLKESAKSILAQMD
ncbi:MAG: hypothetical protein ACOYXY_11535 [Thermodesulfobacteriota bacterium]